MTWVVLILGYLTLINAYTAYRFSEDKRLAKHKKQRISEKYLHKLELAGGIFAIILLMFTIRHKNQKSSYFILSYLILIVWLAGLYLMSNYWAFK